MATADAAQAAKAAKRVRWDSAQVSVVVPIGIIVTVAIVCIIVAVWTSAQRADEVALDHEKNLLMRSIANHGDRVLRELESASLSDTAVQTLRDNSNPRWVEERLALWLKKHFDHDFVFVAGEGDKLNFALLGYSSVDPRWFNSILPELAPTLNFVRGRSGATPHRAIRLSAATRQHSSLITNRVALIQQFLGRPAMVAAVLVLPLEGAVELSERERAPVVMTVRFIDDEVLAEIAARLQLDGLRRAGSEVVPVRDRTLDLVDEERASIARFAWTPRRPGSEIVNSVLPFMAIALAGFAVLVGLVYAYMRRTTATISESQKRLHYLALHDSLSGLPNRNAFGERLESCIAAVRQGSDPAALLYIDLDHFKDVNDTLGHPVGDELIRHVTRRLAGALRPDDFVARLGGDEFAVITPIGGEIETLQRTADRIIAELCAPYLIGSHTIMIGASIGIALIDGRLQNDAADVMRYADMALYRAKNEGRNRACIYDAVMNADLSNRTTLEHDLRKAIDENGLQLQYQPIVNASGEKILGVEALCRWPHPERGYIEPAKFIPIAENSGLIIQLGEWVLRRACEEAKTWQNITISVNVSPLQFRRLDFVDVVERILKETDLEPSRLELELTESTLLGNVDSAEVAMHRLKAIGVQLALDDFGTGYSSLAYLRRFPFDKLKIDRSFVRSIERASDAAAIVHAIVGLGRGLGMKVTAEGVETAEQQLFLRAAGVHSMQGYRFGKPGSPTLISARLATPGAWRSIEGDAAALAG